MYVFTASLIAASALAVTETYEIINEDSEMLDPDDTWDGQYLTLTTTVDGDEIEFCINAIAPGADDDDSSEIMIAWTDGDEYIYNETRVDVVSFYSAPDPLDNTQWAHKVNDSRLVSGDPEPSQDWTLTSGTRTCDEDGSCEFVFCATRALVTDDSMDLDLPFKGGSEVVGMLIAGDNGVEAVVVVSGAMSLGLALFSATGAALTLI